MAMTSRKNFLILVIFEIIICVKNVAGIPLPAAGECPGCNYARFVTTGPADFGVFGNNVTTLLSYDTKAINTSPCSEADACYNAPATCVGNVTGNQEIYTCQCNNGYVKDPQQHYSFSCSDIDECSAPTTHNCDANANCTNLPGSFNCTCNPGFTGNGISCNDIDGCATNTCGTNGICTNQPGSFACQCNAGYYGDGVTCSDIDECATGIHGCSSNGNCSNTDGNFVCSCASGYSGDGNTCTDINECDVGTHNCDYNGICTNINGTFTCSCKSGYSGDGIACTDIDECATGTHNCSSNGICLNIIGSFACSCKSGYSGDGNTCADIDECATNTHNCGVYAACTDIDGSFDCACAVGQTTDGYDCSGAFCHFEQYRCLNGECQYTQIFCDGYNQCSDRSDEIIYNSSIHTSEDGIPCRHKIWINRICLLPKSQTHLKSTLCNIGEDCPPRYFKCANGEQCVHSYSFCNGYNDCSDDSDEIIYSSSIHTTQDGIPCRNKKTLYGICLLPKDQAHLESDFCLQNTGCPSGYFECLNGERCIQSYGFCDGYSHCSDGSDEVTYNSSIHTSQDGISCRHRTELNRNCLLPKDQAHMESKLCNKNASCPSDYFKCSNEERCIHSSSFCNGYFDCRDGRDEIIYNSSIHTSEDGSPCRHKTWLKRICLLPKDQAHLKSDLCRKDTSCPSGYFQCSNEEQCISSYYFCDGYSQCSDNSDEVTYNSSLHTSQDGISCRHITELNRICLLPKDQAHMESQLCSKNASCPSGYFQCSNEGRCISSYYFCDGHAQCSDGSDDIIYNSSIHTPENGIPCRHDYVLNRVCLLPKDQSYLESTLCRKDANCRNGRFKCASGDRCIDGFNFCEQNLNDYNDFFYYFGGSHCSDGSDEIIYNSSVHTSDDGIPCRHQYWLNNVCLLPKNQTDKEKYLCRKGSDCYPGQFKCLNGEMCISNYEFCNRHSQCRDGSDEIIYDSTRHTSQDGIPCRSMSWLNTICLLPKKLLHLESQLCNKDSLCLEGQFKCGEDERCIPGALFCSGEYQCGDGSDEIRYSSSIHTSKDGIACRNRHDPTRICLLPKDQIHLESDLCWDGKTCQSHEFLCTNGEKCLQVFTFCDGRFDCSDGSDEIMFDSSAPIPNDLTTCRAPFYFSRTCLVPKNHSYSSTRLCASDGNCLDLEYKCSNGEKCVAGYRFCDGNLDCSDGSDEIYYNPEAYNIDDGVLCQPQSTYYSYYYYYYYYEFNKLCLLPRHQSHKEAWLCRNSKYYGQWSSWSECSESNQTRSRTCLNAFSSNIFFTNYYHYSSHSLGPDTCIMRPATESRNCESTSTSTEQLLQDIGNITSQWKENNQTVSPQVITDFINEKIIPVSYKEITSEKVFLIQVIEELPTFLNLSAGPVEIKTDMILIKAFEINKVDSISHKGTFNDSETSGITVRSSLDVTIIERAKQMANGQDISAAFITHQSNILFESNIASLSDFPVYSIQLFRQLDRQQITLRDLSDPIRYSIKNPDKNKDAKTKEYSVCSYYNISMRDWSFDGCNIVENSDPPVCGCTHTTNFALLVQRYPIINNIALNAFGYICCTISTLSVLALFIIYLYFKKLRIVMSNQLHVHLCLSLFIAYLTFLSGALRNNQSRSSCTAVAFILQFSLLSSWGWMLVENIVLYRKFVMVFTAFGDHFVRNSAILVYMTSLIASSITLGASETAIKNKLGELRMSGLDNFPSYYISDNLCWLQGFPLYFGFLLPIFLMLFINIITFVVVIRKLSRQTCKIRSSKERDEGKKNAFRVFSLAVLLGITWIFAVPSLFTDDAGTNIAFSWLFSLANALQGFVLFYLFAVRHKDVREMWWKPYKTFRSFSIKFENQSSTFSRSTKESIVNSGFQSSVNESQKGEKSELKVTSEEKMPEQEASVDQVDNEQNQQQEASAKDE